MNLVLYYFPHFLDYYHYYFYEIEVQLWDTAGQERFRSITATYYKKVPSLFFKSDKMILNYKPTLTYREGNKKSLFQLQLHPFYFLLVK